MLVAVIGIEENSTYEKRDFNVDLSDGWVLLQSDGTQSEITFPYDYPDENPDIRISRTLPDLPDYAILQIMCNYRSMTAYVDGVEIFHALPSTFGAIETDMGHYVALIPLDDEYSGKEIEIHISERESGYRSEIRYVRLTSAAQYGLQILEENAFHLVFSLIMMICAIALLATWFVIGVKNAVLPEESYHSLLWTSLFAASVGVWFFAEAYVWAVSTGSFAANGLLSYTALSLMPLSLLGILKSICTEKLVSLRWIVIVAKILLIAKWILFLSGLADFSQMLVLMHVECILAAGIFAVFLVMKRELFLVGTVIRYGIWVFLAMLVMTIVAYLRSGNWLLWALSTAFVLLASITLSTFIKLNRAIKEVSQTKQYKEYALTDIMTGLKSRYAFTMFEARQRADTPSNDLYLIFMDIDMLKHVNDTLGHAAGDEMIIAVSRCIRGAFDDVAECFRMGGDEFLVAMSAQPEIVQERLALFDRLVAQWSGKHVDTLTVSYGVVAANEHPDLDFESLLKTADDRMYLRKRKKAKRKKAKRKKAKRS
jgi:diguanylate cyclase (GGDEF)-like protein